MYYMHASSLSHYQLTVSPFMSQPVLTRVVFPVLARIILQILNHHRVVTFMARIQIATRSYTYLTIRRDYIFMCESNDKFIMSDTRSVESMMNLMTNHYDETHSTLTD